MAGPQRATQDAPQAPAVPPSELVELREQLEATQVQLERVLAILNPPPPAG